MKAPGVADVGPPNPDLKNSPIVDDEIEEGEYAGIDESVEVCYFNGIRYASGDYVYSGDELLRCENGVWIRSEARVDEE